MDAYHSPYRLIVDTHPLLSTNNGSKSYNNYSDEANFNEANFDTNMVIILAALLCALICALMLNSIVRCVLRCQRRFVFESAESAAARLATTGLKKSTLVQIPVAVYGSSIDLRATDCPICLGEFVEGERVRLLPRCNHGFHMMCIDTWLASHSSCPTCRQSLLEQPMMTSSDSGDVEAGFRQPGIA